MQTQIRIKFCGLTRPEDAFYAASLGVDAVGLVFYEKSARAISRDRARQVIAALPAFVTVVALFLDSPRNAVESVLDALPIDLVQFHGTESRSFCESFKRPYMKALPMASDIDPGAAARDYPSARALLLDAHEAGKAGGQGKTFDWRRADIARPIVLAGGLTPRNVGRAIATVQPGAVDVSSGIESEPGIKDKKLMKAFVDEARRAA